MKQRPKRGENNPSIKTRRNDFDYKSLDEMLKSCSENHLEAADVLCGYIRQNGKKGFYLRIRTDGEALNIKIGGYCAERCKRCSYHLSYVPGSPYHKYKREEFCPEKKED